MLTKSLRVSRNCLVRAVRSSGASTQRTYVTASAVRKADQVQDMYLRELRQTKPTEVKASDAAGHVQTFSKPKTPKSPEEANLSGELKEYQSQSVEVEGQASSGEAAPVEQDWFEEEEDDEETPAAH